MPHAVAAAPTCILEALQAAGIPHDVARAAGVACHSAGLTKLEQFHLATAEDLAGIPGTESVASAIRKLPSIAARVRRDISSRAPGHGSKGNALAIV